MAIVLHMLVIKGVQVILQGRQLVIGAGIGLSIEDITDGIPNMDKGKHLLFQLRGFVHNGINFLAPSGGQVFFPMHFSFCFFIALLADNGIPYHLLMDKGLEFKLFAINTMIDHFAIFIDIAKTIACLHSFLYWYFHIIRSFFVAALKVCNGFGYLLA